MTDVLAILYTYDRNELLSESLKTMFNNPGMNFRLWVVDNGSYFSDLYGDNSGRKQLNTLLKYYRDGKIEHLILNNRNVGCNHAVNQLMALAKLNSEDPLITPPDFVFQSNDDMVFEDEWLKESYQTLIDLEGPERVMVVSPFHCHRLDGGMAHGMNTIKTVNVNDRNYEIKNNVSGNTWFMRGDTWLRLFDWYPVNHPTEGGDWSKLNILHNNGYKCAITPEEMAHHSPDSQGKGKYNRLGHW